MSEQFLEGRWKKLEGESPEAYVARLRAFGDDVFEIITGVRKYWNMTLGEASPMVITKREINLLLTYQFKRGVSREGVRRILQRELGIASDEVWTHIDKSRLWETNGSVG